MGLVPALPKVKFAGRTKAAVSKNRFSVCSPRGKVSIPDPVGNLRNGFRVRHIAARSQRNREARAQHQAAARFPSAKDTLHDCRRGSSKVSALSKRNRPDAREAEAVTQVIGGKPLVIS